MSVTDTEQTFEAPSVAQPPADVRDVRAVRGSCRGKPALLRGVRDPPPARLRPGGSVSRRRHEPVAVRCSGRASRGHASAPIARAGHRAGAGRDPTRGRSRRADRRSRRRVERQAAGGSARAEADGRECQWRRDGGEATATRAHASGGRDRDAGCPADQQLRASAGLRDRTPDASRLRDHPGDRRRGRAPCSVPRRHRGRPDQARPTSRSRRRRPPATT